MPGVEMPVLFLRLSLMHAIVSWCSQRLLFFFCFPFPFFCSYVTELSELSMKAGFISIKKTVLLDLIKR